MLVLTRRIGEVIVINDDIRVKVIGVNGHHIRLGFEAPPHVHIARSELLEGCYEDGKKLVTPGASVLSVDPTCREADVLPVSSKRRELKCFPQPERHFGSRNKPVMVGCVFDRCDD